MGRYYNGDISGKFWFGIQPSDDASQLGGKLDLVYRFHGCGCEYDYTYIHKNNTTQNDTSRDYCVDCYSSYEEHKQVMTEEMNNTIEGIDVNENEEKLLWHLVENEIHFTFEESILLTFLEEFIQTSQEKVGKYMETFHFLENTDTFEYDFDFSPLFHQEFVGKTQEKQEKQETQELMARLCLAKQIFYCLKTHGFCSFYAET